MSLNKLAILLLIILLIFSLNITFGQSNTEFEIITSENLNRIVMLSEFGSGEMELNSVMSMDFNSQSHTLAYGTNKELVVWDVYEEAVSWRIPIKFGLSIQFASDSPFVAVAGNQTIYIWDDFTNPIEWRVFPSMNGVSGNFDTMRIIGEGQNQEIIAATTGEFGIFRWQISTGELIFSVHEPYENELSYVQDVLLSEDGQILAQYGRSGSSLAFIDTSNAEALGSIILSDYFHEANQGVIEINLLAVTEDNQFIANLFSFGNLENSVLALINPDDLTLTEIEYDFEAYWIDAALSANSDIMAVAEGFSGSVYFFNKDTNELIGLTPIIQEGIGILAFSPDGKFIATGNGSGLVRIWSIPKEE